MFKKFFGNKDDKDKEEQAARYKLWNDQKSAAMEGILGKEYDKVMHAVIPYFVGGSLDLYYYPYSIPGTGIATKELIDEFGKGPRSKTFQTYELVMFTRETIDLAGAKDETTAFGKANSNINSIMNLIARYSAEATLNPGETIEFPADMERVGGKCLILDSYDPKGTGFHFVNKTFGLMLIMEIFKSEMEWAMSNGGTNLISKLKGAGIYPYSDLNRNPIL